MSAPHIPPRPLRSKPSGESSRASEGTFQAPHIPPRPTGRHADHHDSSRDSFATSPLNDPPFLPKAGSGGSIHGNLGHHVSTSNSHLPARPPSVTLPSIGQEGNEYADIANMEPDQSLSKTISGSSETTTSHVGSDLPLHAPKPSLSQSDARARIQGVTRTDSEKAASVGMGRRSSVQNDDPLRGLKSKTSMSLRSASATSTERPGSTQAEEQGIPEIGIQVPMYPNAGDVQAPSPAMSSSAHGPPSAGFPSDRARHHGRTRSGREVFHGPPGSYGLHGHGINSTDKFEKAWYDKHPEALAQEGQYSPALSNARGDYVLSSEDLNKLVQDTAKRSSGFGTAANVVGLPDEQIGYMASEEYAARMASRPNSSYATKAHGNNSQTNVESPLRHTRFPADLMSKQDPGSQGVPELSHSAGASEDEPGVIHIDAPNRKWNKITGEAASTPTIDLGPKGGNTEYEGGDIDEQGYGVPILASDEIRPGSEWQKPAVSPLPEERRASLHDIAGRFGSRPGSATNSRPTSRPGSIHGHHAMLSRYTSHEEHDAYTPLDDVEEYEPLFKDDEKTEKKPLSQAERLKHRPDMRRRFPSQDIWEDTPNSLQLQAEVQSPPPPEQAGADSQISTTFESPEKEAARKGEVSEHEKAKLLPKEARLAMSNFKPHLREEMHRPGLSHRFPSRDIWEDSPDSARLETTVGGEPAEEDAGLAAGAVVRTSALSGGVSREGATSGASIQPSIWGEAKDVDAGALSRSGKVRGGDAKNAATADIDLTSQAQQGASQGTSISTGSALVQTAKDGISGLFSSLVGTKEGHSSREGTTGTSPRISGTPKGHPTHERIADAPPNIPKEQAAREKTSPGVASALEGHPTHKGLAGVSPNVPPKEQAACQGTTSTSSGAVGTSGGQSSSEGIRRISPSGPPRGQAACERTTVISPAAVVISGDHSSEKIAGVSPGTAGTIEGQNSHGGTAHVPLNIPPQVQTACGGTTGSFPGDVGTSRGQSSERAVGVPHNVLPQAPAPREGSIGASASIAGASKGQSSEGTSRGQSASEGIASVPPHVVPQAPAPHEGTICISPSIAGTSKGQISKEISKDQSASRGIAGALPGAVISLEREAVHEGIAGNSPSVAGVSQIQPAHEGTAGLSSSTAGAAQGQPIHERNIGDSASAIRTAQGHSVQKETTGAPITTANSIRGQSVPEKTAGVATGAVGATQGQAAHEGTISVFPSTTEDAQRKPAHERTDIYPSGFASTPDSHPAHKDTFSIPPSAVGATQGKVVQEGPVDFSPGVAGSAQVQSAPKATASVPTSSVGATREQAAHAGTAGVPTSAAEAAQGGKPAYKGSVNLNPSVAGTTESQPTSERTTNVLPGALGAVQEISTHEGTAGLSTRPPPEAATSIPLGSTNAVHEGCISIPSVASAGQEKPIHEGTTSLSSSAIDSAQRQPPSEAVNSVPLGTTGAAHEERICIPTATSAVQEKPTREGTARYSPSASDSAQDQAPSKVATSVPPGTTNAVQGQAACEGGIGIPTVAGTAQETSTHERTASLSSSGTNSAQRQPPSEAATRVPLGTATDVAQKKAAQGQAPLEERAGTPIVAGAAQGKDVHEEAAGSSPTATGFTQNQSGSELTTGIPPGTTNAPQGQAAQGQATKEQPTKEQAAQEQATKGQAAQEQDTKGQVTKEQATKEQPTKEQAAQEQAALEQSIGTPNVASTAQGKPVHEETFSVPVGVPASVAGTTKGQTGHEETMRGPPGSMNAAQGPGAQGPAAQGQAAHEDQHISTPTVAGVVQGQPGRKETSSVPSSVAGTTEGPTAHGETTTGIPNLGGPAQKQPALEGGARGPAAPGSNMSQVPQGSGTKATPDSERPITSQAASQNTSTRDAHSMGDIPVQAKERATAAEASLISVPTSTPSQTILDSTVTNKCVPEGSNLGQTSQGASGAGSVPVQATPEGQITGTVSPTISADHRAQGSVSEGSHATPQVPPRPSKQNDSAHGQATHPQVPARPHKHHHHHHHAASPHEQSRLSEVYTAPSQFSEVQHQHGSQSSPSEDQRGSPTEGRKVPVIPHRPKPHAPRAANIEPSNAEGAAAAPATRGALSPPSTASPQGAPLGSTSGSLARGQNDKDASSASPEVTSPVPGTGETKATGAPAIDHAGSIPPHGISTSAAKDSRTGGPLALDHSGSTQPRDNGSADVPSEGDRLASTSGIEGTTSVKDTSLDLAEPQDKFTGDLATEHSSAPASQQEDSRSSGTSRTTSGAATGNEANISKGVKSPPLTGKPKPAVPARPAGSKIAALQAGFMSDLNKRLQLGPQPPQKGSEPSEEKREEKAPLADARKARAKGPTRRKPATSSSPAADTGLAPSTDVTSRAGVDAGTSAVLDNVSAPFTTLEPICLWQVPSTGVFDPVHANSLIEHQPTASPDGTVEDAPTAPSNLASEPTSAVDSAKESILPVPKSDIASDIPSEEPEESIVDDGDV